MLQPLKQKIQDGSTADTEPSAAMVLVNKAAATVHLQLRMRGEEEHSLGKIKGQA